MSFLKDLFNQANPFDGGKTFSSSQQRPQLPQRKMAQPMTPKVGQAQVPYSQDTADEYNAHPERFFGKRAIDPKHFGYPEDISQYGGRQQQNSGGAEDDMLVNTRKGQMPLSSVEPGRWWQNPETGFTPQHLNKRYEDGSGYNEVGQPYRAFDDSPADYVRKLLGL